MSLPCNSQISNEFNHILSQIRTQAGNGDMCWKVRDGKMKEHNKIVLDKCNDKDDAQWFIMKDCIATEEDEITWMDGATVVETNPCNDLGGWYSIHPMNDPDMLVGVRAAEEKAWLRLETFDKNNIDLQTQVFFGMANGEVILGDASCDFFNTCLFVTNQGINMDA
eukprot:CAMPEP_0183305274 /NCGR_PEP_ID=MMETSP0160_2-20130417/10074_1 /TAXON_ID=2839 ORGANISM="Odontella Sinensis, Strain Grunow 1884" /NCGR_SAMPLE_ID=MMETSP0160_2 /ASSEMBLY_ACC=CAM_ASM_000250 /LENGTH=165 /DNA_ID=CAMNT_0025468451 /DNA_START=65 /DNA_END=558 /DNA_ORIENTATION=-